MLSSTLSSAERRAMDCPSKLNRILGTLCRGHRCEEAEEEPSAPAKRAFPPLSMLFRERRLLDREPSKDCCHQRCTYRELKGLCCDRR